MAKLSKLSQNTAIAIVVLGGALLFVLYFAHTKEMQAVPEAVAPVRNTFPNPYENIPLTAEAAIVVDLSNGHTLYSKNPDTQLPLASLTKLLTLYAASRVLSPNTPVAITDDALAEDGDTGLSKGQRFTFKNLAELTLVASSNDGARAIADTAGNVQSTDILRLLSGAVASAGLSSTYALNGTGLDESTNTSGAYGTARDMTKLAEAFITQSPELAEATTHRSVTVLDSEGTSHTVKNTNQEVATIPGILLSKTGYTDLAGGNLVVVFDVGIGHPIAIVVLGSTHDDRFTDVAKLTKATLLYFSQDQ